MVGTGGGMHGGRPVAGHPHYRHHRVGPPPAATPPVQPRALSATERAEIRAQLNSTRFVDSAPAALWATLLDEGRYLCSESSLYVVIDIFSRYVPGWLIGDRESASLAEQLLRDHRHTAHRA